MLFPLNNQYGSQLPEVSTEHLEKARTMVELEF